MALFPPVLMHIDLGAAFAVCGLGLVLGIRHATDADHIVALSTIVSRQRSIKQAALVGSLWGLGHTITIFLVGSLIILFGVHIPPRLGLGMEFCVALMLVLLGLLNLTGMMQRIRQSISSLRSAQQRQALAPEGTATHRTSRLSALAQPGYSRSMIVGLVHGLAGSAAVALLVLATIHDPLWATLYLLIFGVGTIVGMVLMTTAVALPLSYGSRRFARLNASLATLSGVISLCFGLFLMYELGYVGGLFSAHPHWTPS